MALFSSHSCHQLYIIPYSSSLYGHGKLYNQAPIVQARILQSCSTLPSSSSMTTIFVLFLIHSLLRHWDPHQPLSDYNTILLPILLTVSLVSSNSILPVLARIIFKMTQTKKKNTQTKHEFNYATVLLTLFIFLF